MIEFDLSILANWFLSGFRVIRYRTYLDYGVISLLKEGDIEQDRQSYCLPLHDADVIDMARGVEGIKIYVDSDQLIY